MEKNAASLPSDLKDSNRRLVLEAFCRRAENSAVMIAEETGLSRQTVKKCIDYYIGIGTLESCGKGASTSIGGKRPDMYRFQSNIRLVSIQMHHRDVEVASFDLNGRQVGQWNSGDMSFRCFDEVLEQIEIGYSLLSAADAKGWTLIVTLSSPLGYSEDHRLNEATPYPSWPDTDFMRDVQSSVARVIPSARQIELYSDGTAAGAALLQRDYAKFNGKIYVTFYTSNGIGGSLFIHGVPQNSRLSAVCSMGHYIVSPEDPEPCFCGNHGCLERQVSRERLRRRLAAQPEEYAASVLGQQDVETVTYRDIFRGAAMGDRLCQQESRRSADHFAVAVKNLILTLSPDYIVFQGEFGAADTVFRRELQSQIEVMKMLRSYKGEICYDPHPLNEEEALGNSYWMLREFVTNNEMLLTGRK